MFATFIDNKILSQWEEKEPLLRVFDGRIEKARLYNVRAPSLRSSVYQRCTFLSESGEPSHFHALKCYHVLHRRASFQWTNIVCVCVCPLLNDTLIVYCCFKELKKKDK